MSEISILTKLKGLFFDYFSTNQKVKDFHVFMADFMKILNEELHLDRIIAWKRIGKDTYILQNSTNRSAQKLTIHHIFNPEAFTINEKENKAFLFHTQNPNYPIVIELQGIHHISSYSNKWKEELSRICFSFIESAWVQHLQYMHKHRFKKLFLLTEKLHSSMDKNEVLKRLYEILHEMFPHLKYTFFLSHDYDVEHEIPVKDLEQELNTNEEAMAAFLSGTVQQKNVGSSQHYYVPISGMQGVYGIIQLLIPIEDLMVEEDIMFVELTSKAGGKALENAKLYEQSKRLVNDLQLINETTQKINKKLRISDTMEYMVHQIMQSFSADEAAFVYLSKDDEISLLPGFTSFFNELSSKFYIHYVLNRMKEDKEGLFIGNLSNHLTHSAPYQSLMAVPMMDSENLKGFAIVLHKEQYAFTFDMYKLMQSLISHSTLAFINSMLREELEKLVITDQLTKLYSRKYLDEAILKSMNKDGKGVFILVDIDNFKRINDTFGHQVGDEVIKQVADVIKSNIREGDIAARWGGEELAVYLPNTDLDSGILVANRLVSCVEQSTKPRATISCGVSCWDCTNNDTFTILFKRADAALYLAKNNGKNIVYSEKDLTNV